jgi:hypothetical protein
MLLMPQKFQRAVSSYTCSAPDVDNEGFAGYMEVKAIFHIKDLDAFNNLWKDAYVYPSERAEWYYFIARGIDKFDPSAFNKEK